MLEGETLGCSGGIGRHDVRTFERAVHPAAGDGEFFTAVVGECSGGGRVGGPEVVRGVSFRNIGRKRGIGTAGFRGGLYAFRCVVVVQIVEGDNVAGFPGYAAYTQVQRGFGFRHVGGKGPPDKSRRGLFRVFWFKGGFLLAGNSRDDHTGHQKGKY